MSLRLSSLPSGTSRGDRGRRRRVRTELFPSQAPLVRYLISCKRFVERAMESDTLLLNVDELLADADPLGS